MMQDLGRFGVTTITAGRVTKIIETGIEYVEISGSETPGGATGDATGVITQQIEADTVVVAVGSASHNPLEEIVKELGMAVRVIGDAGMVGTAFDAVHAGYKAGKEI
jgi:2,4-dienoyl-CoA reductase (NADPH2)